MRENGDKCGEAKQLGRILCDLQHLVSIQRTKLARSGPQQPYPCILNHFNRGNNAGNPTGHMRKGVVLNPHYLFFFFCIYLLTKNIFSYKMTSEIVYYGVFGLKCTVTFVFLIDQISLEHSKKNLPALNIA